MLLLAPIVYGFILLGIGVAGILVVEQLSRRFEHFRAKASKC